MRPQAAAGPGERRLVWGRLAHLAQAPSRFFQQDALGPATATAARVDDPHAPVVTTPVTVAAEAVAMATEHLSREFQALGHLPLDIHMAALRRRPRLRPDVTCAGQSIYRTLFDRKDLSCSHLYEGMPGGRM